MWPHVSSLLLLAASGLFQAVFSLPVRHVRGWRWEQLWVAQSVSANVLFPLIWCVIVPAGFWHQVAQIPPSHWLVSYAWGLLWGLGGVAWSLTLGGLGIAFANSFVLGASICTGALVPLIIRSVEFPAHGLAFAFGLGLCTLGTVLIGFFRGRAKERPLLPMPQVLQAYRRMIVVGVFAGCATAGYGLAFACSFWVIRNLVGRGISPLSASLVVVLPVYLGAASVAVPLGIAVAARAGGLSLFFGKSATRNWSLALVMGLCAAATAILYGFGGSRAGHPSPNIAFGLFTTSLVLAGIGLGFATGEMRGLSRRARTGLAISVCALLAGGWLLDAH